METACSVAVQDTFSILIDSNIEELCLFEQNHNRVSPYRMVHVCAANFFLIFCASKMKTDINISNI